MNFRFVRRPDADSSNGSSTGARRLRIDHFPPLALDTPGEIYTIENESVGVFVEHATTLPATPRDA